MSSEMPTRKSVQPVLKIIEDLKSNQKMKEVVQPTSKTKPKREKHTPEKERINELVHLKDEQIKKMVEKISALHTYNSQFSLENDQLKHENLLLKQSLVHLKQKIESTRNQRCSECQLLQNEKKALESEVQIRAVENHDLRNDIEMMKILVYRLNVQLERHQEIRGKNLNQSENFNEKHFPEMPQFNWGSIKSNVLSPLLNAYEEIIDSKNSMIQEIGNELNTFNSRLNEVLQENEKLQEEMDKMTMESEKFEMERSKLQTQFEVCRKRADLQTKRADIVQEKLIEMAHCYDQKIQSQNLDFERIKDAYSRVKDELNSYKNLPKGQTAEVVVESLKECKNLFEELKNQHTEEKTRFLTETKEMKSQIVSLSEDLTKSKTEVTNLNIILEKQKECNEALNNKLLLLRKSRESIKNKLKIAKTFRNCDNDLKARASDLQKLEQLLRQKHQQIQSLQVMHSMEVEKLNRKMQYKEGIIKKLLQDQLKINKTLNAKG